MASAGNDFDSGSSINNTEERPIVTGGGAARYSSAADDEFVRNVSRASPSRLQPRSLAVGNANADQHSGNAAEGSSRTAKTIHSWIICTLIFHFILLASLVTLVWLADTIFPSTLNKPTQFGLHFQVYVHVGMWLCFMVLFGILSWVHRTIRRTLMCLDLHNRTKRFKNFLLIHHSAFKIVVLLVVTMMSDMCADNKTGGEKTSPVLQWLCRWITSRILLVQVVTSVECAVAAVVMLLYMWRVVKHCRQDGYRMFVDSTGQFYETTSSLGGVPVSNGGIQQQYLCNNEVGLQPDETQTDIIEAQSDEINALKRHNANLTSKLLKTQEQIKRYHAEVA